MEWFEHIAVLFIMVSSCGLMLMIIPAIEFRYDKKEKRFSYLVIWIVMLFLFFAMLFENWDKIFKT